jgi:cardiolipin synthase
VLPLDLPEPSLNQTSSSDSFRWLESGDQAFGEMLSAIEAATESVRLEMYIFSADPLGERFRDSLIRASRRGVHVRVLVDAWGSWMLPSDFWDPLLEAGGQFRWFNPLQLRRFTYRDHRKMLVSDKQTAFVGGFNIAQEYEGNGVTRGWRDLGLQVNGPLARELAAGFDALFDLADLRHRRLALLRKSGFGAPDLTRRGRLLPSRPERGLNPIKYALRFDLARARQVQIIAAYFLPAWRLRRQLARVARRGGRVQLILPGKTDVWISQLASQSLYQRLLQAGVDLYEYQPQILHAKLIIIDEVVYVGSANLDARSLNINYEFLVRVADAGLAREAERIFTDALTLSHRVDPEQWRQCRSVWRKTKERWAYFFLARVDAYIARRQLRNL